MTEGQCALYARVSSAEGMRLIFCLREIRCSQEAVVAEARFEAAQAAATQAEQSPLVVNVVTVPSGYYQQLDGSFQPSPEALQIEHQPLAAAAPEIETRSLAEERLLDELNSLSFDELKERAIQCGLDLSLLNSSSSTSAD